MSTDNRLIPNLILGKNNNKNNIKSKLPKFHVGKFVRVPDGGVYTVKVLQLIGTENFSEYTASTIRKQILYKSGTS